MNDIRARLVPQRAPSHESEGPTTDPCSEVLRAVCVTRASVFEEDAAPPPAGGTPRPRLLPAERGREMEQRIDVYLITAGPCRGGLDGDAPIQLEPGDVIVFPHGDAHMLSSMPARDHTTGRAEPGHVIHGVLHCAARPSWPLLSTLPRRIHLPRRATDVLEPLVKLAQAESLAARPGSECVLVRLGELVFVEIVRRFWSTMPPENTGWLAGLRHDSVGRILGKLHDRPAHGWTLNELAREGGMSRSVLAERFSELVGVPPMQYLAEWRMQLAARLLADTSLSLAEIAERVGYGSETALSRAYKRHVGMPPAEFRRRGQTWLVHSANHRNGPAAMSERMT